jgi:hypothetical protein
MQGHYLHLAPSFSQPCGPILSGAELTGHSQAKVVFFSPAAAQQFAFALQNHSVAKKAWGGLAA